MFVSKLCRNTLLWLCPLCLILSHTKQQQQVVPLSSHSFQKHLYAQWTETITFNETSDENTYVILTWVQLQLQHQPRHSWAALTWFPVSNLQTTRFVYNFKTDGKNGLSPPFFLTTDPKQGHLPLTFSSTQPSWPTLCKVASQTIPSLSAADVLREKSRIIIHYQLLWRWSRRQQGEVTTRQKCGNCECQTVCKETNVSYMVFSQCHLL